MDYPLNPSMNLLAVLVVAASCFALVIPVAIYTLCKIRRVASRFSVIIVAFSILNCLMGFGYCLSSLLIQNYIT